MAKFNVEFIFSNVSIYSFNNFEVFWGNFSDYLGLHIAFLRWS